MALGTSALASSQTALETEGTISFVGKNLLRDAVEFKWVQSTTSTVPTFNSTDVKSPAWPINAVYDGRATQQTRAATPGAGQRQYALVGRWTSDQTIDTAMFRVQANGNTIDDVFLEFGDDATFTDAAATRIALWAGTTGSELSGDYRYVLWSNTQWTGVLYFRLRIFLDAVSTDPPGVSEVYLGERRTMPYNPNDPWSSEPIFSDVEESVSRSGDASRFISRSGYAEFEASMDLQDRSSPDSGINGKSQAKTVWRESRFGTDPVLFFPDTQTPARCHLCRFDDTEQILLNRDFSVYEWSFALVEHPPFVENDKDTVIFDTGGNSGSFTQGF